MLDVFKNRTLLEAYKIERSTMMSQHKLEIAELKKTHELEIRDMRFKMEHSTEEEVSALKSQLQDKTRDYAVLKKENEMLDKIVDINADIVDVKELVKTLISKLPNIDIKSINVSSTPRE